MRAAFITAPGPADTITAGELPIPRRGPTDVLVTVETAAVNPVDTFVRPAGHPGGGYLCKASLGRYAG